MAIGRPTKYPRSKKKQELLCNALVDYGKTGLSFEIFGIDETAVEIIGSYVVKDTLYKWVDKYPAFSDAKKLYTMHCRQFWEKKSNDYLIHTKEGRQLNSTVWIFNMRNRFGWRNDPREEMETIDREINLKINVVSADDD